jgi:hypothetical protein
VKKLPLAQPCYLAETYNVSGLARADVVQVLHDVNNCLMKTSTILGVLIHFGRVDGKAQDCLREAVEAVCKTATYTSPKWGEKLRALEEDEKR